jgi:hypothetical protein
MNENREVIIPGVSGVLRFLADGINSVPDDNNIVDGMKVISKRYPIAQGRIQGIPLSDLIKDTDMEIVENENKESSSVERTLREQKRFYDELGL